MKKDKTLAAAHSVGARPASRWLSTRAAVNRLYDSARSTLRNAHALERRDQKFSAECTTWRYAAKEMYANVGTYIEHGEVQIDLDAPVLFDEEGHLYVQARVYVDEWKTS